MAASTDRWFYTKQGQELGPVTSRELRQFALDGRIEPADIIRKEGHDKRGPAIQVKGLVFGHRPSERAEQASSEAGVAAQEVGSEGPASDEAVTYVEKGAIVCPRCRERFHIDAPLIGKTSQCLSCGLHFRIEHGKLRRVRPTSRPLVVSIGVGIALVVLLVGFAAHSKWQEAKAKAARQARIAELREQVADARQKGDLQSEERVLRALSPLVPKDQNISQELSTVERARTLEKLLTEYESKGQYDVSADAARKLLELRQDCPRAKEALARVSELAELASALKLARQQDDFDRMYLTLSQLKARGAALEGLDQELSLLEASVGLREKLRLAQADHDHERVVLVASSLLDVFPKHSEARRAFRESGLVFHYLQEAIDAIRSCMEGGTNDGTELLATSDGQSGQALDLPRIFASLDKARNSIREAKRLDPHFVKAVQLGELIDDTRDTFAMVGALCLFDISRLLCQQHARLGQILYKKMAENLGSASPSETWEQLAPLVKQFDASNSRPRQFVSTLASCLESYREGHAAEFVRTSRRLYVEAIKLREAALNPTGTMLDYRAAVQAKAEAAADLIAESGSAIPNKAKIAENLSGLAKLATGFHLFGEPEKVKPILKKREGLLSI